VTFEQPIDYKYKHVIKAIRRPSYLKLQFIFTFYYDFVIFADTMSSCVVRTTNVSVRQHALECDVCRHWTTFFCAESDGYMFLVLVQGQKFQGTKVPGSESSRERKFHVTFAPGSESTWERKFHNSLCCMLSRAKDWWHSLRCVRSCVGPCVVHCMRRVYVAWVGWKPDFKSVVDATKKRVRDCCWSHLVLISQSQVSTGVGLRAAPIPSVYPPPSNPPSTTCKICKL